MPRAKGAAPVLAMPIHYICDYIGGVPNKHLMTVCETCGAYMGCNDWAATTPTKAVSHGSCEACTAKKLAEITKT